MKIIFIIIVIIVSYLIFTRFKKQENSDKNGIVYVKREGKQIEADEAFFATSSGDLNRMLKALETKTNPIDRHFLLMNTADEGYKNRKDEKVRKIFKEVAKTHLKEFPQINPFLKSEFDGILPRVSTFQKYATVLTEDGEFKRAIEVCQTALSYGLNDGTKSGFEGRIKRIEKKARMDRGE